MYECVVCVLCSFLDVFLSICCLCVCDGDEQIDTTHTTTVVNIAVSFYVMFVCTRSGFWLHPFDLDAGNSLSSLYWLYVCKCARSSKSQAHHICTATHDKIVVVEKW